MALLPFGTPPTPPASATKQGKLKLAGDLGGTASLPTVPSLTLKEDVANKDTDPTLSANSDTFYPSQKAIKTYVDNRVAGLEHKDSCDLGTVSALPANTYNNGAAGVGATLTGNVFGALSVDGTLSVVGYRILVKDEVTTPHNGIYDVVTVGNGGAAYVLRRSTDFDGSGDVIDTGDTVLVTAAGATLDFTTWTVNSATVTTVGTDPITFAQTGGPGALVGGDGIDVTGNVIDVDATVARLSGGLLLAAEFPALTGDITTAGGALATTLASVIVAGSVGSSTAIPILTYDAKGRLTAVSSVTLVASTQRTFAFFA